MSQMENIDLSTFGSMSLWLVFSIPDVRALSRKVSYPRNGNAVKIHPEKSQQIDIFSRENQMKSRLGFKKKTFSTTFVL